MTVPQPEPNCKGQDEKTATCEQHKAPIKEGAELDALGLCPGCADFFKSSANFAHIIGGLAKRIVAKQDEVILVLCKKIEVLEAAISELKPKAAAFDRISKTSDNYSILNAAKALQIIPSELLDWLARNDWIYRRGINDPWHVYQNRIDQGFMSITPYKDRRSGLYNTELCLTPLGLGVITILLNRRNYQ